MRGLVRIVLAAAAITLAACGQGVLDTAELEAQIAAELERQTGVTPSSVDCPADVPAEEGGTFRCTVTADDGSSIGLTVTQTDDQGSIDWEVDQP